MTNPQRNLLALQQAQFDSLFGTAKAVGYKPQEERAEKAMRAFIKHDASDFEPFQIELIFELLDALNVQGITDKHQQEALAASDYLAKGE